MDVTFALGIGLAPGSSLMSTVSVLISVYRKTNIDLKFTSLLCPNLHHQDLMINHDRFIDIDTASSSVATVNKITRTWTRTIGV